MLNHSLIVLNVATSISLLRILNKLITNEGERILSGRDDISTKVKHEITGKSMARTEERNDEEKNRNFFFLQCEKRKEFGRKYFPSILSLMFGESEWDYLSTFNQQ